MKKLLLISAFSAAVFSGVDAQTLDGQWTDGIVTYYAKKTGSDYLFDGFLGEDRSFTISKTAQNKFVIKKESEDKYARIVNALQFPNILCQYDIILF